MNSLAAERPPEIFGSVGWVLRSYIARWRFWWFGLAYAIVVTSSVHSSDVKHYGYDGRFAPQVAFVAMFASVPAAFAALHLRRLLSGPTAHVVPGYAGPHFVGGAIVNGLIWVLVPGLIAWVWGYSVLHFVGWHALAGMTFAIVLLWPRLVLVLALWPICFFYATDRERIGAGLLIDWVYGRVPELSVSAILLAAVLYPVAAWAFWRFRDRNAMSADDLAIEPVSSTPGVWRSLTLRLRDGAIAEELLARRWFLPQVYRVARAVCGLLAAGCAGDGRRGCAVAIGRIGDPAPEAGWMVINVSSVVLLFVPFSSWRFRARALELEFLRPVTRDEFTHRFWSAMLYDFGCWTALAILVSWLGCMLLAWHAPLEAWVVAVRMPALLICLAVLVYGAGLIALRSRFWLPWLFGSLLLYVFLLGMGLGVYVRNYPIRQGNGDYVLAWFCIPFAVMGLFLGTLAYWRWPRAEIR